MEQLVSKSVILYVVCYQQYAALINYCQLLINLSFALKNVL